MKYNYKIKYFDNISNISDFSYEEQLELIKKNPKLLEYIQQPSFKLCQEAMYINPRVFYKIKRTHPNHKELLEFYRYLRI